MQRAHSGGPISENGLEAALLLGMRLRIAAIFASATLAGCAAVESALPSILKPTASIEDAHLDDLSLKGAQLVFDVRIDNPYKIDLPLLDASYALESGGVRLFDGKAPMPSKIPANGSAVVKLPVSLRFDTLVQALEGIKAGSVVPYKAVLELGVDTPDGERLAVPIVHQGELPIPSVPKIELTKIDWGNISLKEAAAVLHLEIESDNDFPIELDRLKYDLELANTAIASATVESPRKIGANDKATLEIPIRFDPKELGSAALRFLGSGDISYDLSGALEVDTPYGEIDMPFQRSGETTSERDASS